MTALHVAGLWAVAVVQPLLDILGRAPEFFVAHRAGPTDILLLLLALLVVAPLAPIALIGLAGVLGSRPRSLATGTIITVLVGLVAVQVLKHLGVTTWTVAAAPALAAGLAAAMSYSRFAAVRSFFTMLAAGILIVAVAFAQQPGIRRLIVPDTKRSAPADPGTAGIRPGPVVLIVFDELPLVSLLDERRSIDPNLYPNMSALAHDGVWFRNATTVSAYTRWALPAIVTGLRPKRDAVPTSGNYPDTLFSFLGRTHRFEVIESLTAMCPRSLCVDPTDTVRRRLSGIGADLSIVAAYVFLTPDLQKRLQLPDLTTQWAGFKRGADAGMDVSPGAWQRSHDKRFMEDRRQLVGTFIEGISASDQQPTLYFLHTLLPHQPWVLLPSGQRNSSLAPLPGALREVPLTDEWELAQNQQRHLLQVGFIDRLVGRVVARLKETGLYERALVVITSDHGVAFMAGEPNRTLSLKNVAEIMRVPLFIKFPAGVQICVVVSTGQRARSARQRSQRREHRHRANGRPRSRSAALLADRWRIDARGLGSAPPGETDRRWRREYRFSGTELKARRSTRRSAVVSTRSGPRTRTCIASRDRHVSASSSDTPSPITASPRVLRSPTSGMSRSMRNSIPTLTRFRSMSAVTCAAGARRMIRHMSPSPSMG